MTCYLPTGTAVPVDACKSFRPGGSCCQTLPASQPEGSIKSGRSATAAPGWLITTAVASLPPAGTYKAVVVYYPAIIVIFGFFEYSGRDITTRYQLLHFGHDCLALPVQSTAWLSGIAYGKWAAREVVLCTFLCRHQIGVTLSDTSHLDTQFQCFAALAF